MTSQDAMLLAEAPEVDEAVAVQAGLLQPEAFGRNAFGRKPLALVVGFVVLAAGAATIAMGPGKSLVSPKKVRDLTHPDQLFIRRNLAAIDWETPCYQAHLSSEMNIKEAWDSFMQDGMEDELTEREAQWFYTRWHDHIEAQIKPITDLHEKCELWAQLVKKDLEADKPICSQKLVELFNQTGGHSFSVACAPNVANQTHSDMEGHTGLKRDPDKMKKQSARVLTESLARLSEDMMPDDFDTASQWPECADVIERKHNQGPCGSSWAFGILHAVDSRLCIATHGAFQRQLSRSQLTTCTYDQDGQDGCQGGMEGPALEEIAATGIPTGGYSGCIRYFASGDGMEHFAHQDPAPACYTRCDNYEYHRDIDSDNFVIPEMANYSILPITSVYETEYGWTVPADWKAQIKQALMDGGPVTSTVNCEDLFMLYSGGIYDVSCDGYMANHVVSTIGWASSPQEHFVIMNSWGEWGEDRSGKMRLIPEALCDATLVPIIDGEGTGLKVDGLDPDGVGTPAPRTRALASEVCEDQPVDWEDPDYGIGCPFFDESPHACEWGSKLSDENIIRVYEACCACGGGTVHQQGGEETGPSDLDHIQTELGYKCQFPFTDNGKTYHACTEASRGAPWCATELWDTGAMRSWDYCAADAPLTSDVFSVKRGPCQLGVGSYKGCVTREQYDNDEQCVISVPAEGVTLYSHEFQTERGFDKLFIDGVGYSGGTSGTFINGVQATDDIIWASDFSATDNGWIICDHPN